MRLSDQEVKAILKTFKRHFLSNDAIWLFGSRVDDSRRGGDIDLLIETHELDSKRQFDRKINFLVDLKREIGEQKIDIVIHSFSSTETLPIVENARKMGVKLQ